MSALDTRIAHSCHLKWAQALDQDQSLGKDIDIVKENFFKVLRQLRLHTFVF